MGTLPYRIFIFRHGQTEWNREGRIQGHLDVPLNEVGRGEAHRLALGLRRIRLDGILTSDLSRARHTAELALAESVQKNWHGEIPILSDMRFREVSFGKFQGHTKSEIREKFGDAFANLLGSKIIQDEHLLAIGAETADSVLDRILGGLNDALESFKPGSSLGLSTHGGVVRRLLHYGAGIVEVPSPIPNATFYQFHYDPKTKELQFSNVTEFQEAV